MKHLAIVFSIGLRLSLSPSGQTVPSELSRLVAKARVDLPIVGWCRGKHALGKAGPYAVAVGFPGGGGRYLVLKRDATAVELAIFQDTASLSCYTPAEAKKLAVSISESETIDGRIVLRWSTTVVCGFVDHTTAVCWQYSPVDSKFVRVGGWTT
jgi:hypothetical protein